MHLLEFLTAFLFGVLIGNYTTTLLFRIPKQMEICGISKESNQPPCCSTCFHSLKFYEYLPILSWIFCRFKCNYCSAKINMQYFYLECSTAIASVIIYLLFGYSEEYLLLTLFFAALMLAGIMNIESNAISAAIIVLGMIFRTLTDQSIIPFIMDISVIFIVFLPFIKLHKSKIHLILQSSVWMGFLSIIPFIIYYFCNSRNYKYSYLYSLLSIFISKLFILKYYT